AISSLCLDPTNDCLAVARIERAPQAVSRHLQAPNHRAHLIEQRHQFLRALAALESLAHELEALAQEIDLAKRVAECRAQPRSPNRVLRKVLGETQLYFSAFLQERVEQIEQHIALLARGVDGRL